MRPRRLLCLATLATFLREIPAIRAAFLDTPPALMLALDGSGGSFAPLEMNMRRTIPFAPLRYAAAALANVIIAGPRLAPEQWVPRIAPRQFVMASAEGDERLPRASVEALYRSAREPRSLIWMRGRHVHADTATIRQLADIVLARVRATPSRREGGAAPSARRN